MRRSGRNRVAGRDQLSLDLLWGPAPDAQEQDDESVRGDGRASLAPVAAEPGGGVGRPDQLLLDVGGGGGGADRRADDGPGGGRPAGRELPGQGGPAEHGPAAGRGDGAARDGAAPAGAGGRGGRRSGRRLTLDGALEQASLWDGDWTPVAAADAPVPVVEPTRFRPASQDDLAPSGAVARIRANIEAI